MAAGMFGILGNAFAKGAGVQMFFKHIRPVHWAQCAGLVRTFCAEKSHGTPVAEQLIHSVNRHHWDSTSSLTRSGRWHSRILGFNLPPPEQLDMCMCCAGGYSEALIPSGSRKRLGSETSEDTKRHTIPQAPHNVGRSCRILCNDPRRGIRPAMPVQHTGPGGGSPFELVLIGKPSNIHLR